MKELADILLASQHKKAVIADCVQLIESHVASRGGLKGMALKTGLISRATGKGKHTTTGSQLYPLSGGGWLADSAGIRALATWNIAPEELASCFIEFRPFLGTCEYSDCSHVDEEGCAILQAVTDGAIDEGRHRSYTRILLEEER